MGNLQKVKTLSLWTAAELPTWGEEQLDSSETRILRPLPWHLPCLHRPRICCSRFESTKGERRVEDNEEEEEEEEGGQHLQLTHTHTHTHTFAHPWCRHMCHFRWSSNRPRRVVISSAEQICLAWRVQRDPHHQSLILDLRPVMSDPSSEGAVMPAVN